MHALKCHPPCHSALLLNLCETGGVEIVYRHCLRSAEKATGACLLRGVIIEEDDVRKNTPKKPKRKQKEGQQRLCWV